MKIAPIDPPRSFAVKGVTITHAADIRLNGDEMVTFKTPSNAEYDVAAKEWGFYATPSTNGRLKTHGFRTALSRNAETGMRYVLLVEIEKMAAFDAYCREQNMVVDAWLDEDV